MGISSCTLCAVGGSFKHLPDFIPPYDIYVAAGRARGVLGSFLLRKRPAFAVWVKVGRNECAPPAFQTPSLSSASIASTLPNNNSYTSPYRRRHGKAHGDDSYSSGEKGMQTTHPRLETRVLPALSPPRSASRAPHPHLEPRSRGKSHLHQSAPQPTNPWHPARQPPATQGSDRHLAPEIHL